MAHPVTIPRLGWSMEQGVLSQWLKEPGEHVHAGDMLYVLEGEKAAQDIESFDSGILCVPPDAPRPGTTVQVGQVVGFLLAEGETPPDSVGPPPPNLAPSNASAASVPPAPVPAAPAPATLPRPAGPAARRLARELGIDLNTIVTPDPTGRVLLEDVQQVARNRLSTARPVATPRARRVARELGFDWTQLRGSGRDGRIRERDVVAHRATVLEPSASEPAPSAPGRHVPASRLRRAIAHRMSSGVHGAAPVTIFSQVDADDLVAFRARRKADPASTVLPSYNDILVHLTALTLREAPELNACWFRDGIHQYDEIHIALAVDTPQGLLAPVVRHTDRLDLDQVCVQSRELINQARAGRLAPQQLEGGTFTLTNLGMFGIDAFTPILNLPQAAILGVGRILQEPVVRDGLITIGHTLTLSLTFDHRVVDGAPAARWLQRLAHRVAVLEPTPRV